MGEARTTLTNLPEVKGNLIANFPLVMLFVGNIMMTEEKSKKFAAEISLAACLSVFFLFFFPFYCPYIITYKYLH